MNKKFNFSDFLRDENKIKFKLNRQKRNLSAEIPRTSAKLDIYEQTCEKQLSKNDFFDSDLSDDEVISEDECEENETHDDVFLCFLYKNGKIGCCSYDASSRSLKTFNDMQENSKFELVDLLINDLNPSIIITCHHSDQQFIRYLKLKCFYKMILREKGQCENKIVNEDLDTFEMEITEKYQKRKIPIEFVMTLKNDFNFDSSLARINEIDNLLNMPEKMSELDKNIFLSCLFDFESKFMIQSVGGLLRYLDRKKVNFELNYNLTRTPILTVSKINLDKILILDSNAFKSLDIFKAVDLNCALRQHDLKKSTSFRTNLYDKSIDTLYGLYSSKILTKIGIKKLRSVMLKPIRDTEVLNERHRFVEFFLKSENTELTKMLRFALKKCKFINNILRDMRIARCNITEWKRLYNTTKAFLKIHELIQIINSKISSLLDVEEIVSKNASFESSFESKTLLRNDTFINSAKSLNSTYLFGSVISKDSTIEIHETISTDKQNEFSFLKHQRTPLNSMDYGPNINSNRIRKSKSIKSKSNIFKFVLNPKYRENFEALIAMFESIVDVKESSEQESKACKKIHVNPNISDELDEKKLIYSQLSEYLNQIAQEHQEIYRCEQCTVMYALQIGFLIGIVYDENMLRLIDPSFNETASMEFDEENESYYNYINQKEEKYIEELRKRFEAMNDLERKFKIDNRYYYKNDTMRGLDFEHGDLGSNISDLESNIIDCLQTTFVERSHFYASMNDVCAELDCLLAFAAVARENDFAKPNIIIEKYEKNDPSNCKNSFNSSFIKAINVRHPLIENNILSSAFIPNNVECGQFSLNSESSKSKLKVLTAPNASGKTIYLKQVGLLVYMSMIGSYVAADSVYIGDFDRILTRINSNDSIEYKMSTFAVDLSQITECVMDSTEKSLVIIDEFGKGTDPNDAQALIAAVIKFWINQEKSPQVYLSTHFYEMFDLAERLFGEKNNKIEYLTLEYLIEDEDEMGNKSNLTLNSSDYGKQKLIFMYKIKTGKTNSSFALNIARKGGLSENLVERACEIRKILKQNLINEHKKETNELNKILFDLFNIPEHKEILKEVETNLMDLIKRIDFHEENNSTVETRGKSYLECLNKMFKKSEMENSENSKISVN